MRTQRSTYLAADKAALEEAVKCGGGMHTWSDIPIGNEALPINCVTWYEAMAFCIWDGGYLPTEAEWNYAAAGGSEQRAYPWSAPPDSTVIECEHANHQGCGTSEVRVGSTSPQGDGRWGHADLAGNVAEWCLDWYVNPYPTTTCIDCANLMPTSSRVFRGGNVLRGAMDGRTADRDLAFPDVNAVTFGVRCARTP